MTRLLPAAGPYEAVGHSLLEERHGRAHHGTVQAVIVFVSDVSELSTVTAILRGFAFSATGIRIKMSTSKQRTGRDFDA